MTIERQSPLAWPAGEARTPALNRQGKSLFNTSEARTLDQLDAELRRFRASNIVLSIDLPFRGKVADTAACLFFDLPGNRATAICCDLYLKQDDNIRALYKIVCAMRDIERFGGQNLSQKSFTGFAALAPPPDIWKALGISKGVGEGLSVKLRREYVMEAFRDRAKEGHAAGKDMAALTEARDEALKAVGSRVMGGNSSAWIKDCKRGRMSPEDRDEIERLAAKMKKPKAWTIARKINRHPATVNWYMLTHGLVERKPGRARGIYTRNGITVYPYSEQHDEVIEQLRVEQKTYQEIADTITAQFGITRSAHSVQVRMVQLAAAP